MAKVVLGLSGGVDSAVCARLLQEQGHEVLGLYLDIGTAEARSDALAAAAALGVSLEVLDISRELEECVCRPFTESYLRGETLPCEAENGWCAVGYGGCPLGLGKAVNGILKNHYPKGLRKI